MNLPTAQQYAAQILRWLAPHALRLEIAGSIRRQRPVVNDIDVLCLPKITEHKDLLGEVAAADNHVEQFLREYVQDRNPASSAARSPRILSSGPKSLVIQLPRCQLDLWFATPETWATRLLCRTGSKDHNIWLAQRAKDKGYHWNPYEGFTPLPPSRPSRDTEESIYAALGLPFIEPQNRELPWLKQHIDPAL